MEQTAALERQRVSQGLRISFSREYSLSLALFSASAQTGEEFSETVPQM